jgi:glycosyltransferase involved in cell wall biosynthesis
MTNAPLQVCLFPSAFYPSLGGIEELVRQLCLELKRRGDQPTLLVNRWPRDLPAFEEYEGLPIHRMAMRVPATGNVKAQVNYHLTHRFVRRKTLRILRQTGADVMHVQGVSCQAVYALHAKRALGLPLVVTLQGELTMDARRIFEREPFAQNLMRQALRDADIVTGCSGKTLADGERFLGASLGDKGRVIFNGASVDDFKNAEPYAHPRPYVLALGRMVPQKGFDILLRAWQMIKPNGVDLLLAGDGPDLNDLQRQALDLGLDESAGVKFLGRADRPTTASLFRGSLFVALPSRTDEGLPVVCAETMAAGKTMVGTSVGGVPEAFLDGESGLIVERDDVDAFAAALKRMLDDDAMRTSMAAAAAKRAEQFGWQRITSDYQAAYRDAIEMSSQRSKAVPIGISQS